MEWIYPNEDVTVKQLLHQLYILSDTSVNLTTALYRAESKKRLLDQLTKDGKLI